MLTFVEDFFKELSSSPNKTLKQWNNLWGIEMVILAAFFFFDK